MYKNQNFIIQSLEMQKKLHHLNQIEEVPLKYQNRPCTDVCCIIIGVLFSSILMILAIVLFNYDHFFRVNFPSDSDGRLCGFDGKTIGYNYVYFVDPPSIERRVCVSQCPKKEDKALNCAQTQHISCRYQNTTNDQIIYYENVATGTRNGYFCYPQDQSLKQKLLQNSKLSIRQQFYNSIDTIKLSFFISLIFCVVYLLLVQFLPQIMNYAVLVLGSLVLIAAVFCVLFYKSDQIGSKLFFVIIPIIFAIIIGLLSLTYMESMRMFKVLLKLSAKIVANRLIMLVYIPIFLVLLFAFMVIIVLEFTSFWTLGNLTFDNTKQLYYELQGGGPIVFSILVAIQLIWGFTFIKTAFSYCISCLTVQQIFKQPKSCYLPFKQLMCKNLGSVIACSFMVGFLAPFDILLDYLKPNANSNPNSICYRIYNNTCRHCGKITRFIRQDAIAYINLTGNPYCNAARYCQYLTLRSQTTQHTQSISRIFRISAYLLLVGIMLIFALYVKGLISLNALYIIGVLTIFTSSLFISLHCDIAETIQISFLLKEELSRRKEEDITHMVESEQNQYFHQLAANLIVSRLKQKNR